MAESPSAASLSKRQGPPPGGAHEASSPRWARPLPVTRKEGVRVSGWRENGEWTLCVFVLCRGADGQAAARRTQCSRGGRGLPPRTLQHNSKVSQRYRHL